MVKCSEVASKTMTRHCSLTVQVQLAQTTIHSSFSKWTMWPFANNFLHFCVDCHSHYNLTSIHDFILSRRDCSSFIHNLFVLEVQGGKQSYIYATKRPDVMPSLIVNLERKWSALLLQCHMGLMGSDPPCVATWSMILYQNSEYCFFFLLL